MTINCKGRLIDLSTPKVMGILNITPDSFYDGGKYQDEALALTRAEQMLAAGADFIDVGGYSSRPGASDISIKEELSRVIPAIDAIIKRFADTVISIDTFRSEVAYAAIDSGASIVNDISAGSLDLQMMETVASLKVPYIMMHMRGTPQTMKSMTEYNDLMQEILFYFSEKITQARSLGISDLILDPGFGFAKTLAQNYELLGKLELLQLAGLPVLVGISRKAMTYKLFDKSPDDALNATTALHAIALMKGGNILRVHDVKEAVEAVKLHQVTNAASGGSA